MRTWHVFTLSSLWEGLPCAVVEARFLGMPVIAYDVGGIAELIKHEKNGLLVKALNTSELATAMLRTASQPELYQALRTHKDDLHAFTLQAMTQEHCKTYDKYTG
jgi:glycosyltransferase involved in cell wall biosynthesis